MTHVRTQIRVAVAALLAGSADAGGRVQGRRSLPQPKGLSPTFIYAFQNERSNDVSMGGTQERVAELRITACAKGDAEATEDILDRMAVHVDQRLSANADLGGLIQTWEYLSTEYSFSGEGEQTLCTAALTYALTYYTRREDSQTSL